MFLLSIFGKKTESSTTLRLEESSQIKEMKTLQGLPWFGALGFRKQKKILLGALTVGTVLTISAGVLWTTMNGWAEQRISLAGDLQRILQRSTVLADHASRGDAIAFDDLKDMLASSKVKMEELKNGSGFKPGIPSSGPVGEPFSLFAGFWEKTDKIGQAVGNDKTNLITVVEIAKNLEESAGRSVTRAEQFNILLLQDRQSSMAHVALGMDLIRSFDSASLMAREILLSKGLNDDIVERLSAARNNTKMVLDVLKTKKGIEEFRTPILEERTKELINLGNVVAVDLERTLGIVLSVKKARDSVSLLQDRADMGLKLASDMVAAMSGPGMADVRMIQGVVVLLLVITLFFGWSYSWVVLVENKHSSAQVEESIMYIMNDLTNVAEGDLTVKARITEDITGAISDSINYTVATLNTTIGGVQRSSDKVAEAAEGILKQTDEVRENVIKQAEQIETAANSVVSMTESIAEVADATEKTSLVAEESRVAAESGKKAVNDAIGGMEVIRNQIQETSKRIKRLGESSQEIGEIVTLISDMTEQTNVLSLNASIQAAAAGEAGRGFRAVATEVQRLSERSEESLKRIVALIQTIQSETQNVIAAMERSTQNVVEGAAVTHKAGEALDDIGLVVDRMAVLIQDIQQTTSAQNMDAAVISERIREILMIARTTTNTMDSTAESVKGISGLAEDLKSSVSQFRLS